MTALLTSLLLVEQVYDVKKMYLFVGLVLQRCSHQHQHRQHHHQFTQSSAVLFDLLHQQ
jgi:hypothetical protein